MVQLFQSGICCDNSRNLMNVPGNDGLFLLILNSHIHHTILSTSQRALPHIHFVLTVPSVFHLWCRTCRTSLCSRFCEMAPLLQTKHTLDDLQTQPSINSSHTGTRQMLHWCTPIANVTANECKWVQCIATPTCITVGGLEGAVVSE